MGLSIGVGVLADLRVHDAEGAAWLEKSLANVNAVLEENGLPRHAEPESLAEWESQSVLDGFPYSFLHYLRRAYAHWKQDPSRPVSPCVPGEDPSRDPVVDDESCMFDSHLLCHSDSEGFYVPVDFSDILIDETSQNRILGGLLGSSYRLREELSAMAPSLGIELENGTLVEGQVARIQEDLEKETGLWRERVVWLALFDAASSSIAHGTAICFM